MSGKQGEWCRIGVNGGVCEWECMGRSPRDAPLTLTRCHSSGLPQLFEAIEGWKSVCGRAYSLKGTNRKFFSFCSSSSFIPKPSCKKTLLYHSSITDDLVLFGKSEHIKVMVGMVECYVEVCRKSLKGNANKSKVMILGADGKEGSELPGGWERVETDWPLVCG